MREDNPLIPISMDIIVNAGDARNFAFGAISDAKAGNFSEAAHKLTQAEEAIVAAHRAQTDTLQAEMSGEEHELCILFIHAQDTLMTIRTEVNMAKEFVSLYQTMTDLLKGKE